MLIQKRSRRKSFIVFGPSLTRTVTRHGVLWFSLSLKKKEYQETVTTVVGILIKSTNFNEEKTSLEKY